MHWSICIILFIVGVVAFVSQSIYVIDAIIYRNRVSEKQKISYKEFLSLYNIAPEKWYYMECETGNLMFLESYGYVYYKIREEHTYTTTYIYMDTYRNCVKLESFFRNIKYRKNNERLMSEKQILIREWKKDINQYSQEAEKQLKQMTEQIIEDKKKRDKANQERSEGKICW